MARKKSEGRREVFYVLLLIALVLQVVAISTDYWSVKDGPKTGSAKIIDHVGLWKMCGTISNSAASGSVCEHLPPKDEKYFPKNSLYAVRIFSLLGTLLMLYSMGSLAYGEKYDRKQLISLLSGVGCVLLSVVIYSAEMFKIKDNDTSVTKFKPGYSFYLSIVSLLMGGSAALYLNRTRF